MGIAAGDDVAGNGNGKGGGVGFVFELVFELPPTTGFSGATLVLFPLLGGLFAEDVCTFSFAASTQGSATFSGCEEERLFLFVEAAELLRLLCPGG